MKPKQKTSKQRGNFALSKTISEKRFNEIFKKTPRAKLKEPRISD